MSEGRVYTVRWKKDGDIYAVQLARKKSITAEGATLDAALDNLLDPIIDAFGDGEPQFKLDPPVGIDPRLAHFPWYRELRPHGHITVEEEGVFSGEPCPECDMSFGTRTDTPLELAGAWDHGDFVMWSTLGGIGLAASERFVKGAPEWFLDPFEQLPFVAPKRFKKRYIELRPRFVVPSVRWVRLDYPYIEGTEKCAGNEGKQNDESIRCSGCGGLEAWAYSESREGDPEHKTVNASFVSETDMPDVNGPIVLWFQRDTLKVAVDDTHWQSVRSDRIFKGVYDDTFLSVIPEEEAYRPPDPQHFAGRWVKDEEKG